MFIAYGGATARRPRQPGSPTRTYDRGWLHPFTDSVPLARLRAAALARRRTPPICRPGTFAACFAERAPRRPRRVRASASKPRALRTAAL